MKELLVATKNKGKINEIKEILLDTPYIIRTLADVGTTEEVSETGGSFEENAILKAKFFGNKTKLLAIAEDSGLVVDVLGGRPGIYSARYAKGSDEDRINKILTELKGVPKEKRTARFRAVIALYDPSTKNVHTFNGVSEGYITDKPIGRNGFGYDPIFFNLDLSKTNARATLEEKNKVSHRFRALSKAKVFLLKLNPRANED